MILDARVSPNTIYGDLTITGNLTVQGTMTTVVNQTVNGNVTITCQNAAQVPLTINGAAAQSAALTQWKNSGGDVLVAVGPTALGDNKLVRVTATTKILVGSSLTDDGSTVTSAVPIEFATADGNIFKSTAGAFYVTTANFDTLTGSGRYQWNFPSVVAAVTAFGVGGTQGAPGVYLTSDAANTLAQRNGANAQTFRGYGTFTDASNYERWSLSATAGTGITIAAETAGSGADNLGITLTPAGTGNVTLASGSLIVGNIEDAIQIGNSAKSIGGAGAALLLKANSNVVVSIRGGAGEGLQFKSDAPLAWASGAPEETASDTFLARAAAANLRLGAAAANPPVAQTLSMQNASGTDIAGANFTIDGSRGTGTGAGGSIIFRTAAAGGAGSSLNALAAALTIGDANIAVGLAPGSGAGSAAASGAIRLANAAAIKARGNADGGDIPVISTTAGDAVAVGGAGLSSMTLEAPSISVLGELLFIDNATDIGAPGATRPRTAYFGTSVVTNLYGVPASTLQTIRGSGGSFAGAQTQFETASNLAATSGSQSGALFGYTFAPASGSLSGAGLNTLITANGVSSGTLYGHVVAVKNTAWTGGTIKLLSLGTTTTDAFTGYSEQLGVDTVGNVNMANALTLSNPDANITWSGETKIWSAGDGIFAVTNNAVNGFNRLILGTNDVSGVSFVKSTTTLTLALGDGTTGGIFAAQSFYPGITRTTASGNVTLVAADAQYQMIDPNGSDRDVTLPTAATRMSFVIKHIGGANVLTLKRADASVITTISAGDAVPVIYDGTAWQTL